MSTTPPKDVVSALVAKQKGIYAKFAAGDFNSSIQSNLETARCKAELGIHPTDTDLFLGLHFLLLGGHGSSSANAQRCLESLTNPHSASRKAFLVVSQLLEELDVEVMNKEQWKVGSAGDALDFQWKVAFSAYVLHSLEIRSHAFEEEKGPALSQCVYRIIKERQPFESILEARSQALSSSAKAEWEETCAGLCKVLPNELTEEFKEAETVLDKAKVLHQAWLEKLGVPASPSKD